MVKSVVVHSQPSWLFCGKVKEFFTSNGGPFMEKDVNKDEAALSELWENGVAATPVAVIDGEAVVGFTRTRLKQLPRSVWSESCS